MSETAKTVTRLLSQWRRGRSEALDELFPIVYEELRGLARAQMGAERPGHTLQPTALVHELYGRLVEAEVAWQDRGHFFAVAARAMRRILVDHARSRGRARRGGGAAERPFEETLHLSDEPDPRLLRLEDALGALESLDPRKARVVELHYFVGLSYLEIARLLELAPSTVGEDLRFAKAWLARELER